MVLNSRKLDRVPAAALVLLVILVALPVRPGALLGIEIDGCTEPYRDIDVAATELGRISDLAVCEGERVQVGQVLARLDDDVLRATLDIAKAGMESTGRVEAAEAELEMYRESLSKLQALLQRSNATPREVERAEVQMAIAAARVKAAREELKVKELEFQRTKTQLDQRRVISPIQGIVTRVFKDEGEFVSPTDPIIVKVVQLDPLVVVFAVPLSQASKLVVDSTVRVRMQPSKEIIEGVVEFVSPTADAQSGTTRVRVRIPNPDEKVPSGITCNLLLKSGQTDITNALPSP